MAQNDFTTVQIDAATFKLLKELTQSDLRSTPKEIRFLVQAEMERRSNPRLMKYLSMFDRAPQEA